jgi:3'-5' exoribonuclease
MSCEVCTEVFLAEPATVVRSAGEQVCVRSWLYRDRAVSDRADNHLFSQSNGNSGPQKAFIRDLRDGQSVESIFVVRERRLAKKRNGEDYLRVELADSTGSLAAVCWEDALKFHELAAPGSPVAITGRYSISERFGPQLTIRSLAAAASGEYDPEDLTDGPSTAIEQMEQDLRQLVETIRNPHLRMLLDGLYGEQSVVWERFRVAPAAKHYHEAYRHGLLEHTLSVAQAVSAISASFPGVDRDLAVTGALIHDIGKIEAYASQGVAIDLTDDGRLLGEIPMGYYLVRRQIEQVDGFPWTLARPLLHIVLSHHGALANGSPVAPMTREAWVVHMVDNMGGKLGSFDRLERGLQEGESWSAFDRALEGFAYFGQRESMIENGDQLPAASGE